MIDPVVSATDDAVVLVALYEAHVGRVYSYLYRRSGASVAEELTSETFMSALDGLRRSPPRVADVGWLLGIARHKLVDHWRREARDARNFEAVAEMAGEEDRWVARLDPGLAEAALRRLPSNYRLALTLRYLDDLTVPEVARLLDRSVHATESVLTRARRAFRTAYAEIHGGPDGY